MSVPLLDLQAHHAPLVPQFVDAFREIATTGRFVLGKTVEDFEKQLASYNGTSHALGVSSGTDALLVALMAMDIGPGDEVITTPFTFFATVGSIARVGATAVLVDIDPATFNIDVKQVEAAITSRTKAIMPVHLFGLMADMTALMAVAKRHNVRVIEDAAQAIGAKHGGKMAGSVGDVGCLSFYPTKNLSALGDAGANVTNDAALQDRMRMMRLHGEEKKYHHTYVGGNFRIDAIQAAMLAIKLPHLDGWADARRRHAARYRTLLDGLPMTLPVEPAGMHHVFNQFTVRVEAKRRAALREHLKAHSIGHEVYYPVPMHEQKCFASLGYSRGDFPEAERAAGQVLSLPVFPEMTESQQDEVATVLRKFFL
jgi:dTDP-4-amino-4,6-dideoxygalactose transaminase